MEVLRLVNGWRNIPKEILIKLNPIDVLKLKQSCRGLGLHLVQECLRFDNAEEFCEVPSSEIKL